MGIKMLKMGPVDYAGIISRIKESDNDLRIIVAE